jgi:mevalonate kinase
MELNKVTVSDKISAPGKIILSGEHAVVYGYPAIATAVNLRLAASKSGKIESDIPIGAGMGSSAAFAAASSVFKVGKLDLEKINNFAYKLEKGLHGNPSGVDNTIVTYGGFLWYRKESESFKTFKQITPKVKLPKLFLLNSGKPVESTKEMVTHVADLYKKRKNSVDSIFKEIETVTKGFLRFLLKETSADFGELMQDNEKLLEGLGVVSKKTKQIIRIVEKEGGCAKISGAGGIEEGSGMVIVYHKDIKKISLIAKKYGFDITSVKLGEEGVRIEKG